MKTGKPAVYDLEEPLRVAESVREMRLGHVVITSVNRDELPDGGSEIWAATIRKVRDLNPDTNIEVLTPDFKGIPEQLQRVFLARPDVFAHNLETVPGLYKNVRPQGRYDRSLFVLQQSKLNGLLTKTGIMVGLGETHRELSRVMTEAVEAGVDIFTIGQYLQPTPSHLPVKRFVSPAEFAAFKEEGLSLGIKRVEAGPLVRSSYRAEEHLRNLRNVLSKAL